MLKSVVNAKVADLYAILADFEQARDCASIYLTGEFNDNMRVKRSLYESAFISFRRGLTSGTSRLHGKNIKPLNFKKTYIYISISNLFPTEIKEINDYTNKVIAHRASPQARYVDFPNTLINSKHVIMQSKYVERVDLIQNINKISDRISKAILLEILNYVKFDF